MKNEIIIESGAAAQSLVPKLEQHPYNKSRKLFVGKITDSDLETTLPTRYGVFPGSDDHTYVGRLLYFLGSQKLIDVSYVPKFLLGSSRLAALKVYGRDAIWTDKMETDDIIHMASGKKQEFGDIDVDVKFVADKKTIVTAIISLVSSTYAAIVSSEV